MYQYKEKNTTERENSNPSQDITPKNNEIKTRETPELSSIILGYLGMGE